MTVPRVSRSRAEWSLPSSIQVSVIASLTVRLTSFSAKKTITLICLSIPSWGEREAETETERHRETDRQTVRGREGERQRDRETDRDREKERERVGETDRLDRHTYRQTETERPRQ